MLDGFVVLVAFEISFMISGEGRQGGARVGSSRLRDEGLTKLAAQSASDFLNESYSILYLV